MESFLADLRLAARNFRKTPGFALIAIAVIALGVGANTAIFTVINTVLLRPLPYPDADRVVGITRGDGGNISPPMFVYWKAQDAGIDDLTAYDAFSAGMNLSGGDRPELVQSLHVSRNYFKLFGAVPLAGRTFAAEEDQSGGPKVALISHGLWQRRFGGDPSMIGKTVNLGGAPYTLVGILSPSFRPNPAADVWLPIQIDPNTQNQAHTLFAAGRLRPGVTLSQAGARMRVIGKQYVLTHADQVGDDDKPAVKSMQGQMTGDVRPALMILLGAVGLVLLIACANVANLLLARAAGRQREIAIRSAIGAGRFRILRQLMTESILLAGIGGVAGLALGSLGVSLLLKFAPGNLPRAEELAAAPAVSWTMLAFTAGLTLLTGILFGILPAIQTSRTELSLVLKESSGRAGTGWKQNRMRSLLVASEMALAVILLCGAMLLIRSFVLLRGLELGFETKQLLTMQTSLSGQSYSTGAKTALLGAHLTENIERIAGVEAAALASGIPSKSMIDMIFSIPGRPLPANEKFHGDVSWRFITPHYFSALGIPLKSGRLFRETEPGNTIVISEAMAKKFWPKENPIGQHVIMGVGLPGFEQGSTEVVGVVGDTRESGPDIAPMMYQPYNQISDAAIQIVNGQVPTYILVRTRPGVSPLSVGPQVEQQFFARDTQLAPTKLRLMNDVMADSLARETFNMLLLGVFAGIALLLAAVGIYGVMSYSVEQRTREIGIRSALGASRVDTLRLVMGQGMTLVIAGVVVGLASAFGLTRLLTSLLYGVAPGDPFTFACVAAILVVVAMVAIWIPALRATKVDPMEALRYE